MVLNMLSGMQTGYVCCHNADLCVHGHVTPAAGVDFVNITLSSAVYIALTPSGGEPGVQLGHAASED